MNLVKIEKLENGILFDTSGLMVIPAQAAILGVKVAKKKFIPKSFGNIRDVLLYNDRIVANDITGGTYSIDVAGANNHYPISHVDGEKVTSLEDLFDKFIAAL